MNDLIALVVVILCCVGAAAIGGYATTRSLRDWYLGLPKPSWNPPNAVFGPVWTVLYLAMAIADWLVWRVRDESDITLAQTLFVVQLVLNVLWSVAFFGFRSPLAGLVVIALLWLAILATIVAFSQVSVLAAAILVPYLLWVTFASFLNAAILRRVGRAAQV
jgi:benzodiazapine receptor